MTAIIFDGDDTLWETQPLYTAAKSTFVREMARAGFVRQDVERRFEKIDLANVAKFGFSRERFPRSMLDTYEAFCVSHQVPYDETIAEQFHRIGMTVFETTARLFDGVPAALSELQDAGLKLILATKGDDEVQRERIKSSGLGVHFERVYILPQKGIREFQQVMTECRIDAAEGWSVGNSVRSDINPALAVGLRAVWISYGTWLYEQEEVVRSVRFYKAESIKDAARIVLQGG